jgi:hypothetical protein
LAGKVAIDADRGPPHASRKETAPKKFRLPSGVVQAEVPEGRVLGRNDGEAPDRQVRGLA